MSKECREAGLFHVFHGGGRSGDQPRAKREQTQERERAFVPEARDYARLLPRLADSPRRVR